MRRNDREPKFQVFPKSVCGAFFSTLVQTVWIKGRTASCIMVMRDGGMNAEYHRWIRPSATFVGSCSVRISRSIITLRATISKSLSFNTNLTGWQNDEGIDARVTTAFLRSPDAACTISAKRSSSSCKNDFVIGTTNRRREDPALLDIPPLHFSRAVAHRKLVCCPKCIFSYR